MKSASFRDGRVTPRGRFGRWLVAACTAVVVSACAAAEPDAGAATDRDGASATASADQELALTAQLVASRRDQANGQIRVRLTNLGEQPIPLDGIRLVAEPYTPEPARINTRALAPGRTVAYEIAHGSPSCAGDAPTPGPVSIEVVSGDQQVSIDPGDSAALIARMLESACNRQRVAELVTIEFGEWEWTEGASEQTGTLVLTRRQAGPPLELTGLRGGVNFALEQLEPGPVTVSEDAAEVRVPVRTRAARCGAHALADNSKPYIFTAFFKIDGEPDIHMEFSGIDRRDEFDRLCEHAAE